jgi:hypothetical protein
MMGKSKDTFQMMIDVPVRYQTLIPILCEMSGLKKWELVTRTLRIGINFLIVNIENIRKEEGNEQAMAWLKDMLGDYDGKD